MGRGASRVSRSDRPGPGDRSAHGAGDMPGPARVAGSEAGQVRAEPRRTPTEALAPVPRAWPRPVRGLGDRRAGRARAGLRPLRSRPRPLRGAAGRAPLARHRRRRPVAPRRNSSSSISASAGARTPPRWPEASSATRTPRPSPGRWRGPPAAAGLLAADDEFDRHFTTALGLHDQTPDVFETARTRLAYGSRLRRERQRVRAREQLRAAIDIFDHLGAEPWSEMARAELAATGETARRRDVTTLNELTPQELQIALRLAEGRPPGRPPRRCS